MENKYNKYFSDILSKRLKSDKKNSSIIQTFYDIPNSKIQSLSIRTGDVVEDFLNKIIEETPSVIQRLNDLDKRGGRFYAGEHQIDILFSVNNTVFHREVKCNTDLDNGKQRDIKNREEEIVSFLKTLYNGFEIDSGILNPLIPKDRNIKKLGIINSIDWFCKTTNCEMTPEQFAQIGTSIEVKEVLKQKGYI